LRRHPPPLHLHVTTHLFFLPLFLLRSIFFFFNDTAPTEIYPLSLHDALPIFTRGRWLLGKAVPAAEVERLGAGRRGPRRGGVARSEEHTSELQSLTNLVCRLLLEKKKNSTKIPTL